MKTKTKLFIISSLSLLSSLAISWNSNALSKDNLNIIYDETPVSGVTRSFYDEHYHRTFNYTEEYDSVFSFLSEKPADISNPSTSDNIPVAIGIVIAVLVLVLSLLFLFSRRRAGSRCLLVLVLSCVGALAGLLSLANSNDTYADEDGYETISIKDKAFYDAFKYCFTEAPQQSYYSSPIMYRFPIYHESDEYYCDYNGDLMEFDDESQSVIMDPDYLKVLDIHSRGVSDISDLLNFRELDYFFAYDNDISDTSILTYENFPDLMGAIILDYNHLAEIEDRLIFFNEGVYLTQSVDINVDTSFNASLPGVFYDALDYYALYDYSIRASYDFYDADTLKIPVHLYNIELSDDLMTAHVINPGEKSYIAFNINEVSYSIQEQLYEEAAAHGVTIEHEPISIK